MMGCITVGQWPTRIDIRLYQGDDFAMLLRVTDRATGLPADLTGATPKAQIRLTHGATEVLAEFDAQLQSADTVYLLLPAAQSVVVVNQCVWDCQVSDPLGHVATLGFGLVLPLREVTR